MLYLYTGVNDELNWFDTNGVNQGENENPYVTQWLEENYPNWKPETKEQNIQIELYTTIAEIQEIDYFYGQIATDLCAGKVVDGELLMYGYDNGDIALYDKATKRLLDRRQTSCQINIVDNAISMAKKEGINVEKGRVSYEHPEYIDKDIEYVNIGLIWD